MRTSLWSIASLEQDRLDRVGQPIAFTRRDPDKSLDLGPRRGNAQRSDLCANGLPFHVRGKPPDIVPSVVPLRTKA